MINGRTHLEKYRKLPKFVRFKKLGWRTVRRDLNLSRFLMFSLTTGITKPDEGNFSRLLRRDVYVACIQKI